MARAGMLLRTLAAGWAAAAVLSGAAAVFLWRELQGLAQGWEHGLGPLAAAALAGLVWQLRRLRNLQGGLADLGSRQRRAVAETGRLLDHLQELMLANEAHLAEMSRRDVPAPADAARLLKVVEEIVLLTNMAAVNAALEATRAPEPAQGIAVVAAEIKKLAGRSADTSHQLNDLLGLYRDGAESARDTVRQAALTAGRMSEAIDRVRTLVAELPHAEELTGSR